MTGLDDTQAGREEAVRDLALKYRGAYPKEKQLARGERRYRRKVASPKQWAAIRAEKLDGQACAICDVYGGRITLHHLVSRSLGGDDVPDNLVPVCGDGTTGCHGKVEARDPEALRLLAAGLSNGEYAYSVSKLGEGAMGRLFGV